MIDPLTHEEVMTIQNWHGGQATMMYAIASTGDLTTGQIRPSTSDENNAGITIWRHMTDAEWCGHLAWELWHQLRQCANHAEDYALEDAETLANVRDKAERASDYWDMVVYDDLPDDRRG
jgi:hypothetical protein